MVSSCVQLHTVATQSPSITFSYRRLLSTSYPGSTETFVVTRRSVRSSRPRRNDVSRWRTHTGDPVGVLIPFVETHWLWGVKRPRSSRDVVRDRSPRSRLTGVSIHEYPTAIQKYEQPVKPSSTAYTRSTNAAPCAERRRRVRHRCTSEPRYRVSCVARTTLPRTASGGPEWSWSIGSIRRSGMGDRSIYNDTNVNISSPRVRAGTPGPSNRSRPVVLLQYEPVTARRRSPRCRLRRSDL